MIFPFLSTPFARSVLPHLLFLLFFRDICCHFHFLSLTVHFSRFINTTFILLFKFHLFLHLFSHLFYLRISPHLLYSFFHPSSLCFCPELSSIFLSFAVPLLHYCVPSPQRGHNLVESLLILLFAEKFLVCLRPAAPTAGVLLC